MWLRLLRRGGWQVLEKGAKAPKEVVWTYDVQARAAPLRAGRFRSWLRSSRLADAQTPTGRCTPCLTTPPPPLCVGQYQLSPIKWSTRWDTYLQSADDAQVRPRPPPPAAKRRPGREAMDALGGARGEGRGGRGAGVRGVGGRRLLRSGVALLAQPRRSTAARVASGGGGGPGGEGRAAARRVRCVEYAEGAGVGARAWASANARKRTRAAGSLLMIMRRGKGVALVLDPQLRVCVCA